MRLNTPVFPEMKIDKTADKSVQFVAIGNGGADGSAPSAKPFTTFALRVGRKEEATDLYENLTKQKAASSAASSSSTSSSTSTATTTSDST